MLELTMAVLSTFTRSNLPVFMREAVLQDTADVLEWDDTTLPDGDYATIVSDVERELGTSDIAIITDGTLVDLTTRKLTWLAVLAEEVQGYDISGPQRTLARSQAFAHARIMYGIAEKNLEVYLDRIDNPIIEGRITAGNATTGAVRAKVWFP